MKKLVFALVFALLFLFSAGCAGTKNVISPPEKQEEQTGQEQPENGTEEYAEMIRITIGEAVYTVSLADTEAARAFAGRLPAELEMRELNGNEKYCYLSEELPSAPVRVGNIEAGDLMLYGSSCVVLFYESFATPYSYTRIGKAENAEGLAQTLGGGDARVRFEKFE